jgi:uncharacterized protein YjbI with pentapeptide repeats
LVSGYIVGPGVKLVNAQLRYAFLEQNRVDLSDADATSADFSHAYLGRQNNLQNAKLTGANFTEAQMPNLDLSGTDLSGLNMTGANLAGTVMTGANINGIELSGANLSGLVTGLLVGTPSSLPEGWHLASGYFVGPNANLIGAKLAGADLSRFNLAGALLSGSDLSRSNLAGADLSGANLNQAVLTGANISGASFLNTYLAAVVTGSLVGGGVKLSGGFSLTKGYLVGPS